ncbi:ATP synthase subunit I [Chengkuizengella axinellae]|uniref:ATP synthase subunit I n=1 Tax=Chengkuizengella axinellae TaxID=3064388 RepID=A0ABT9J5C8_9BACL|nr:ATP synthase subunit I [Chengkuizengella sp. 2205SS18-9]MDP5276821.1 ATP synthase subunit I [Chengkuizengella sp. 2205SS18-9]
MNDFTCFVKNAFKVTLYFLLICFFFWFIFEPYRKYIAGGMLGVTIGLINAWYLQVKINQLTEAAINKTKNRGIGFLWRTSMALLAVIFAIKMEQHFSLFTLILGLIIVPILTLILGIFTNKKNQK